MDKTSTTCQAHSLHDSEGDREFCFWYSSHDQIESNGTNHNAVAQFKEGFGVCSPAMVETYKECKYEYSPLLPHKLHCSNLSPTSRRQRIVEGKRELMEMIQDMPESAFELSFQDLVKEQQVLEPFQKETCVDDTHIHSSREDKLEKLNKRNKILPVESMDSETFLLKMFFPTSLAWMEKAKVGNRSKVSQRPSIQESTKHVYREGKIKKLLLAEENRSSNVGHNIREITRNINDSSIKSRSDPFSEVSKV
ncbi:hypothetical protein L6164_012238 [Bauhinia variegata]|uniref:Uncharacterized protein n=1 Tax=Bauhinia variegata TaxID=167791 RepID=A0ACB9P9Q1_BAUVA|nr:hypothetical protein L6164_012238 [Bauhinia variegata]